MQRISSVNVTTVGASSVQLAPANPLRKALVLFPSNTGRFTISDNTPVVLDSGPTITPSQPPLTLSTDYYGDWVKGAINAIGSVAGIAVGWIDVTETP